ncbi:malto-oligosyltrehalose trehalohydrolase [Marinilabilia rubra]|uniref:Malto-oligosyltrehalose trehalohydrolase n=1 Tax=Marinilabilia rubra TaxID=2162893 RepID=A0A2U2BB58_9BACT|nr:malto-oligosyltrehalose trehalohydrolase [Marinilabilia rubra]PWE00296.1 malto-oligosyltrehalose trehalohydrolase [Marinilabilia rubra]
MNPKHFHQRPGLILNPEKKSCNALVWAPGAQTVSIVSRFNEKHYLNQSAYGYWEANDLPLVEGDTYEVCLNDDKTFPDPASLSQPRGVHGPSMVTDLASYSWNDDDWNGLDIQKPIIYELHTGTFSKEGTFHGIIDQLPYLRELGINTIELMPATQFPGNRNWGYDGVYPYAVQDSYGGAGELQKLVDQCHQQGLAVILDVVYNHLGPEGNYLSQFGPYFTNKYQTPWGRAVNFDDEWSDAVRHFFIENALMWFGDFHIDGLRLDAAHAIKDFGARHFLAQLKEATNEFNAERGKKHFLMAECDLNDVRYINTPDKGGYNMDAQWCDEFHHSLHVMVTGEERGYYSDFGGIGPLVKSLNHGFVYDGIYSPHRKKTFGSSTDGQFGHKFVVFAQNHDQVGNRMMGDRLGTNISFELQKVVAATYLLSPFTPFLFMGEEFGEKSPFLYFTSHSDKDLIKNVRKGRKNEFKDFMGNLNPPDPQAAETFKKSVLTLREKWDSTQQALFKWYKTLIRFRKEQPFWAENPREYFEAEALNEKILRVAIRHKQDVFFMLMNFGPEKIHLDLEAVEPMLCSATDEWSGPVNHVHDLKKGNILELPGECFIFLKTK